MDLAILRRYCILNKGVFPSADCAFILAFSIIMLNTDLHNPSIRSARTPQHIRMQHIYVRTAQQ